MKAENLATNRFVLDTRTALDLRLKLKDDPQAGIRQAAQQFEGLLLQMMLKSMRDATPQDGLLDSDQTRFFTSIFDQQLAQDLSTKDVLGFAKLIEQQMGRDVSPPSSEALNAALGKLQQAVFEQRTASSAAALAGTSADISASGRGLAAASAGVSTSEPELATASADVSTSGPELAATVAGVPASGREYVDRVWPHAVEAAKTLGVPPHFLVAHSALESGWGKSEIRLADGSPSYNVFGIKAGSSWQGPSVEVATTEYEDGAAQNTRAKFRVYGSYDEAFQDYAGMLRGNARFSDVLGQQDGQRFAQSLQQSGYATDPGYADKLGRIIGGTTLRQALAG
jgi:flagellar protein FlgJ